MIEDYPQTAPELWPFILQRNFIGPHPIISVQGAQYEVRDHGIPSKNRLISEDRGLMLKADLINHRPLRRYISTSTSRPTTFAIASPFDVWTEGTKSKREQERFARAIWRQRDTMVQELRKKRILWPYAMLMADFDVANTKENLIVIGESLNKGQQRQRWLLESGRGPGRGFHLIEEELFSPKYYPLYVAHLILDFINTAAPGERGAITADANYLLSNWRDLDKLEAWSPYILRNYKHYGSPGPGRTFIIDMRYFAHALAEWLRFMKYGTGAFGFLRILGKTQVDPPPALVAMKWPYCNTQFTDLRSRYKN